MAASPIRAIHDAAAGAELLQANSPGFASTLDDLGLSVEAAPVPSPAAAIALCRLSAQCFKVADEADGSLVCRAECAALGLAAAAASIDEVSSVPGPRREAVANLEQLAVALDSFAPYVCRGLCQLGNTQQEDHDEARTLHAVQSVCAWSFAAVARVVGCDRLSPLCLWEWASADPLWAFVLCKGALADPSPANLPGPTVTLQLGLPREMQELQRAVFLAACGLGSPMVKFAGQETKLFGDQIGIEWRSAQLTQHRALLASAAAECNCMPIWISAATRMGAEYGSALVSALVSLLQPEIAQDPVSWGMSSAFAHECVQEGRRAAALFANSLLPCTDSLWEFLAVVVAGQIAKLPPGFLQDCAHLAYYCPVPPQLHGRFLDASLAATTAAAQGVSDDMHALAALSILAANAGASPAGSPLQPVLASLTGGGEEAILERWAQWRGPVRTEGVRVWATAVLARAAPEVPAPAVPEPAAVAAPPARGLVLQGLADGAPAEYRCAIDGQLMLDPVQSPQGLRFERSTLAHALQTSAGRCPLTSAPLALVDCERLPDLRRAVACWVRQRPRVAAPQLAVFTAGG